MPAHPVLEGGPVGEDLRGEAGQPVEEHEAHRVAAAHLLLGDLEPLVGQARGVRLDAGSGALGQVGRVLPADLDVADQVLAAYDEALAERDGAERYRVFREVLEQVALGRAGAGHPESALGEQGGSSRGSVRPSG